MTYEQLGMAVANLKQDQQASAAAKLGKILGECFRGVAEYFVFSSESLINFIEMIEDPTWKFLVYTSGVGRMVDV